MKYAYFPGCSAESTARDMHQSTIEVAKALGIELIEPEGWTCCGATAAHQTDKVLAAALPAANLLKAKSMGLDMVASCAACYNRLKSANHAITESQDIRKDINDAMGQDYDGSVGVLNFMEVLIKDVGIDKIKDSIKKSLNGMKVASYYGCLLVRPFEVTKFDDPENPRSLDNFVEAMGGEAIEWPHKLECCGGGLALSRTDVVVKQTDMIVGMAKAAGAECIVVSCPMCQVNLDMRQLDVEKQMSKKYDMPIVYITQLLGLCLGVDKEKLGLDKMMITAEGVVKAIS